MGIDRSVSLMGLVETVYSRSQATLYLEFVSLETISSVCVENVPVRDRCAICVNCTDEIAKIE